MRHFLIVTGCVLANFALWALFTKLPVHVIFIFCLVVASGCLMLWAIVYLGKMKDSHSSTSSKS
jgi:uncharacterized membrane protein